MSADLQRFCLHKTEQSAETRDDSNFLHFLFLPEQMTDEKKYHNDDQHDGLSGLLGLLGRRGCRPRPVRHAAATTNNGVDPMD